MCQGDSLQFAYQTVAVAKNHVFSAKVLPKRIVLLQVGIAADSHSARKRFDSGIALTEKFRERRK